MKQSKVAGSVVMLWLVCWGSVGCGADAEPLAQVQMGFGGQVGYVAEVDAMLLSDIPDLNYGNTQLCIANGKPERACIVRWNLSSIPTNAIVGSAQFSFYVTDGSVDSFKLYTMLRGWNEQAATWNQAASGVPWQTSGAKGATDRGFAFASFPSSTTNTFVNVPIPSDKLHVIQGWVQNPSTNHGIQIARTIAVDSMTIASSEAAIVSNRPKLGISYSFPQTGGGSGRTGP